MNLTNRIWAVLALTVTEKLPDGEARLRFPYFPKRRVDKNTASTNVGTTMSLAFSCQRLDVPHQEHVFTQQARSNLCDACGRQFSLARNL